MVYSIDLDVFEGPLDLLLHLIKKSDMEIAQIPISDITAEYLKYLDVMKELNLEIAGEFLVMAATLMQIKAKMLLPQEEGEEEGPDPLEDFKARLLEYQKFKEVAGTLSESEARNADYFYRCTPLVNKEDFVLDVSLFDLIENFKRVLSDLPSGEVKEVIYEEIPIEKKIRDILDILEEKKNITFEDLLRLEKNRRGLILCFLALLELIRLKQIAVRQKDIFGEIRIYGLSENENQLKLIDPLSNVDKTQESNDLLENSEEKGN